MIDIVILPLLTDEINTDDFDDNDDIITLEDGTRVLQTVSFLNFSGPSAQHLHTPELRGLQRRDSGARRLGAEHIDTG